VGGESALFFFSILRIPISSSHFPLSISIYTTKCPSLASPTPPYSVWLHSAPHPRCSRHSILSPQGKAPHHNHHWNSPDNQLRSTPSGHPWRKLQMPFNLCPFVVLPIPIGRHASIGHSAVTTCRDLKHRSLLPAMGVNCPKP
jgi:hypothetical protein